MFKTINAVNAYRPLLERIYHNSLYVINFGNIETMLEMFYLESNTSNLQTANYSTIMTEAESTLSQYVNANIDNYMSVVLDKCGSTITDTAENVLSLLNNDGVEHDKKLLYISYLQTSIPEITDVDDIDLWEALLQNPSAIDYTSSNVFAYVSEMCADTFDDILTDYINNKGTVILFDDCFEDAETRKDFFAVIVRSVLLSNHIYKGYLEQFVFDFPDFSIEGLPLEKLKILDKLGKIKMSVETLAFMRTQYNDYLLTFVTNHFSNYIDVIPGHYIRDEALRLLDHRISDTNRIALLKLSSDPVSIEQKHYSDSVTNYILQKNYDANDLSYLLVKYSSFGKQTRTAVLEIATKQIKIVLSILPDVDRQLLSALIISGDVDLGDKKTIFKAIAPKAKDDEIMSLLPYVADDSFLALYDNNKRPRINDTAWNKELLSIFKERGLIADYKFSESIQKFTVRRKMKMFP